MRILIVDDERVERNGIRFFLKKIPGEMIIDEAENGETALEKIYAVHYPIVITDIKMPFMDGLALADRIHAFDDKIQIILLSAYGDFGKAQRAIDAGVYRYLLKPVDEKQLIDTVLKSWQRSQSLSQEMERKAKLEDEVLKQQAVNSRLKTIMTEDKYEELMRDITGDVKPAGEEAAGLAAENITNPAVKRALQIIRTDYGKEITLEEIAEKVCLTPNYFTYIFRRQTGMTFVQYLNSYRLDRAACLLGSTGRKINEIADSVGIHSLSYFGLLFRKRYQVSPAQYRQEHTEPET